MKETKIEWLIHNRVILINAYNWDAESLYEDIVKVNNLINASDMPQVHVVWEFLELETYPTNIQKIAQSIKPVFTNPRLGWVMTVIQNPVLTFLAQVGTSMYGARYHSVKTMDEVLPYLYARDLELNEQGILA